MIRAALAFPLVLTLLAACGFTKAREHVTSFHVAPTGNDNNPGTFDKPFATPARAARAIEALRKSGNRADVTVELRAGTYRIPETLVLDAEHSRSTWTARADDRVVFSGGIPLTGWLETELNGRKVWVAKTHSDFMRSLWVADEPRQRARHPNRGILTVPEAPNPKARRDDGSIQFQYAEGDVPPFTSDDAEVVVFNRWIESRLPVLRVDAKWREFRFLRRTVYSIEAGDVYRVENAPEFLNEPGEWFMRRSSGEVYYLPKDGERIQRFAATLPGIAQIVRLNGDIERGRFVEGINFRGITFAHAEWNLPGGPLDERGRPPMGGFDQAAHGVPGAVSAVGARGCTFERCTFTHLGSYGLELGRGCQDNRVSRCTFTDLGAGGIKIGEREIRKPPAEHARGNRVSDCTISHVGKLFPSCCAILIGESYDNVIAHNLIHDAHYTAISVGWTWGYDPTPARGNIIEHNHVHHIGKLSNGDGPVLSDMGAVYTLGTQPGTIIRFNRFHDIAGRVYGGWGIYFDEGSSQILAKKNLVYGTTHGGFHQHYGRENVVRNNIFAFAKTRQIERSRAEAHQSFTFERNIVFWNQGEGIVGHWENYNATFRRNQYWSFGNAEPRFAYQSFEQWQAKGMDEGSVQADPGFVDAENGDFRFKPGSGPAASIGFEPWDLSDVGPRPAN